MATAPQVVVDTLPEQDTIPNGSAGAAILAAGIGSFTLGLLTTLATASEGIKALLELSKPVGPLSGKALGATVVYLIAWAVLHGMWKNRQINFNKIYGATMFLILLGLLGTFPIFFQVFEPKK